ncbi:MAG: YqjF family protein [Nonlabens sp.]|uniref:YqjF family protein n=1 Tax=Nonlabens sp. TaxID=1888209 RepID=UPI003EF49086
MTITDLLKITEHRPWELPAQRWKYYQEWNRAIFMHWQVELEDLKEFVPQDLEIDLFDGKPWISVVAFTMEKIRPRNLPAFAPISNFHEINIRTYVKYNGKTGVYFLSMEGGKKWSCRIAKSLSQLPYRYSKIRHSNNHYTSKNAAFNDELDIKYSIGKTITDKSKLDKWLTERYALFQDTETTINEFEIHHQEWPMNEIEIDELNINYPRFHNLIGNNPHRAAYSDGVQVLAWGKKKLPLNDKL